MSHIFISYKSDDREYVEQLANALRAHGYVVWMDASSIAGSDNWEREIRNAVEEASVVIVVMSTRGEQSPWLQREQFHAEHLNKPIVPILLDGDVWFRLNNIQYVDARNTSLEKPLPENLIDVLNRLTAATPTSASTNFRPLPPKQNKRTGVIIGVAIGALLLLMVAIMLNNFSLNFGGTSTPNDTATIDAAVSATFAERTSIARNTAVQIKISDTTETAPMPIISRTPTATTGS